MKIEEIVIAAWLHDVGKFAQRADVAELFNKDLESRYCKTTKDGRYTHQHVVYTEGFLDKYKNCLPNEVNVQNVKTLAAKHHCPSTEYEYIISVADCLSSGSDRCNILGLMSEQEQEKYVEEKLKFYEKPLLHILSTLHLDEKPKGEEAFCRMNALDGEAVLSTKNHKTSKEEYKVLWDEFVKDFEKLEGLNYDEFLLSLNSLLERYWWCIPSATNADADISLYQHAKTTAAFSAALYNYHNETETLSEVEINKKDTKKFLFINGDISGIQKYIFDLKTTKDNAKLLRAKSFELWALSEILSQYIVKKFGLTYANIMTSAGGKFIIMLSNTAKSKKLLSQIQNEIEEYFLREFAGKLFVIVSNGTEASWQDLQKEKVRSLINKIGDDGDIAKSKKMQKVLCRQNEIFSGFYEKLQINGECPKCGVFPAKSPVSSVQNADTEEENTRRECPSCEKLTEIGSKLVKSSKVVLLSDKLTHFGNMVKVLGENQGSTFYYSVNEYVAGRPLMYLPYVAPKKENGDLLTFEEIAKKSKGNKKLALFKADIDNLGLVFSQSLGERMSFSRYADLSHMLHYFFSSFYAWFVENNKDHEGVLYKEKIYTVFSGGDDLCILGSWDAVMQFALNFRKALNTFTNNNASVTISGGIALVNANISVKDMAEAAENLLEKSKEKDGKNAITVFGTTVSWDEYEKCLSDAYFLQEALENKDLSTGVIYKFIDFANRAEKTLGKNGVADVSELINTKDRIWKSNAVYLISRNVKNADVKNKLNEFIQSPEECIKSRIAVSYALYTQREC